ncbi:MAG TPA: hypothetical protein VFK41_00490 [Nocardioidaceae bacterium]|nr:hypothetical protein [Nocardioidaceae bacterium]
MHVVDHVRGGWYLLEDGPDLYLDVNADPVGGTVRLTQDEAQQCRRGGREATARLAEHLSYHVRELHQRHDAAAASNAHAAVIAWQRGDSPLSG